MAGRLLQFSVEFLLEASVTIHTITLISTSTPGLHLVVVCIFPACGYDVCARLMITEILAVTSSAPNGPWTSPVTVFQGDTIYYAPVAQPHFDSTGKTLIFDMSIFSPIYIETVKLVSLFSGISLTYLSRRTANKNATRHLIRYK